MSKYIVQHRRGTIAEWSEKDTIIPKEGEIVIEIDEAHSLHKLKIGDGIHTFAELAYLQAGDEIITQVIAEAKPRIVTVELGLNWVQDVEGKYSQILALDGITERSRLDLQPTTDMLAEFKHLDLVFVTENKGGVITAYSIGNMPLQVYTMQATIVETECESPEEPIVGLPVGTPVVQADWNQEDDTKADYIKNKPTAIETYADVNPVSFDWVGLYNAHSQGDYKSSSALIRFIFADDCYLRDANNFNFSENFCDVTINVIFSDMGSGGHHIGLCSPINPLKIYDINWGGATMIDAPTVPTIIQMPTV